MKSYGPKCLIDLDGHQTVLGRQIHILKKEYPLAEIIVVVGHEADLVMKNLNSAVKPVENENFMNTNVARSLAIGLRIASYENVLIVYGDLVFSPQAVRVVGSNSTAVVDTALRMNEDEVGATIADGRITRFAYDLRTKWAQIVYLKGRELELFKKVVWNRERNRWFGFEALNKVIDAGGLIRAVEPRGMALAEIDTSKDIERARLVLT